MGIRIPAAGSIVHVLGGTQDDHAVAAEIAERFVEGVGDRKMTWPVAKEVLEKAVERTLGFRGRS